ncbi:MAG: NAD(+)/NADH kinase [Candidatus Aenigmarchaeota archaeon]|nr:NAD(+)/NADH kinase [Candidatus Aenigmarchaeota archaeon]
MVVTVLSSEKHVNARSLINKLLRSLPFDIIVTVGGDGTFLKAFKISAQTGRPVLCVRNEKSKGVLAECDLSDIRTAAKKIKNKRFSVVRYPMLAGIADNHKLSGFNEIGFFRTSEEALRFDLFVNNALFYENVVADGGIISTPAGSTAYNISAGGPVLDLASKSLVFTPLNPHGLNKPIVFEGSVKIVFRRNSAQLFADGKKLYKAKNYLGVSKSDRNANVISLKTPFYTRWKRIVGL